MNKETRGVPDPIHHTDLEETLEYITGWNDCRQAMLAEQPAQQTCNCRWEDEVQVQQCTLHKAHVDAIYEWARRAKAAEAKLKEQPAQQEPVATVTSETGADISMSWWHEPALPVGTTLYTSPQPAQRTWVGLTDKGFEEIIMSAPNAIVPVVLWQLIQDRLKEKNT